MQRLAPEAGNGDLGIAGAAALGHMVGGPVGAAVGLGIKALKVGQLANPVRMAEILGTFERMATKVDRALSSGAAGVIKGVAAETAERTVGPLAAETAEEFTKRTDKYRELAGNPELLQTKLAQSTQNFGTHAPEIAQAMHIATAAAVRVINSSLPSNEKAGPLASRPTPSQSQIAQFNRIEAVVKKPTLLLEHAKAGTLTPDEIAAVGQVSPQLLQEMRTKLIEKLADHGSKPVPYQQRQMIGMLLGQDLDGSMQGLQFNQALLNTAVAMAPAGGIGAIKPTAKGLGKLKLSDRTATPFGSSNKHGR